jgi:hypothetical protein
VPQPERGGRGLRIALFIATIVLCIIVGGVVVLYLEQQGTIDIGLRRLLSSFTSKSP